ncbi:DNA alkylation response protein [Modestobacter sp. I12A-02628]|uniref:DNA alkylation response protein n=1 Tax=Goekera deserti TaxID=2497753 RepID=A0A7K3WB87_9ACTN|nr:acyl-CoA dehydrogenase family protein [Goekera deserti]MPQ97409.1 DNA alkylation response protein [Goekera deserti]NDI47990.1 DNA alkylation response protein [Goekera deserti]NEL53738.1 DNA alkylation response protein [Goekera deserti]
MSRTHEVLNQPPPRTDVDEFGSNTALVEAVDRFGAGWAGAELTTVGQLVGSAGFQHDAELANTHPPVFTAHDRQGHRIDHVEFHPAYHRVIRDSVAHGAHTRCWAAPRPGAHVARAATFMMFAQVEPGHSCPVSMTHSVVPALAFAPQVAEQWLPRVLSEEYDPELRDPATKGFALFGMGMTEKQGGSDVRANTTAAVDAGDGTWLLTGHKWFCSAPQSDAFLVLAQTGSGVSCFLVPRRLPGGEPNNFFIQRLKDKLGNKSNASSEIELDQAVGQLIGEEGRGVRTIIEMVNQTRLDCILGSAAGMRQAVSEAAWHVRHRSAFGRTLIDQPAMTAVIADLQLEAEAATWTALRMASVHDHDDEQSRAFGRLGTAVAKYWVCKRGPGHAYEALECLGGNGYTEQFPLARRYREQPVMAIWEGSGNVIALDVLRAMQREPASVEAFFAEVELASGQHRVLDDHVKATRELVDLAATDPVGAPGLARRLVESMALALQASLLVREAPTAVADGFLHGRLGSDRCLEYGSLPSGSVDLAAITARA